MWFMSALDKLQHIANGFSYSVTLKAEQDGEGIEWQEQRLVVQSLKHAIAQKKHWMHAWTKRNRR
jgi:N-acetylglucosamine-6-phosphate deacetylase